MAVDKITPTAVVIHFKVGAPASTAPGGGTGGGGGTVDRITVTPVGIHFRLRAPTSTPPVSALTVTSVPPAAIHTRLSAPVSAPPSGGGGGGGSGTPFAVPSITIHAAVHGGPKGHLDTVVVPPMTVEAVMPAVSSPSRDDEPVPSFGMFMRLLAPGVRGGREVLTLPPAAYTTTVGGTIVPHVDLVEVAPLAFTATTPAPALVDVAMSITAPQDGDTVVTPVFIIALTAQDDTETFTVQVRYGTTSDFSDAVTVQADVPAVLGGTTLIPSTYPQGTLYWQARLLQNGLPVIAWTAARTLTVDSQIVPVTLPVTWTVDPGRIAPIHLWHLDPPGPNVGDTVTVYGQGFPTSGALTLGDSVIDTTSWTLVPASDDDASDDTRVIDGPDVTPEHYEIVFVAPAYQGPGAALTVEA